MRLMIAAVSLLLLCLPACSGPPAETTVRETIRRHFAADRLNVVSLDLGRIESGEP